MMLCAKSLSLMKTFQVLLVLRKLRLMYKRDKIMLILSLPEVMAPMEPFTASSKLNSSLKSRPLTLLMNLKTMCQKLRKSLSSIRPTKWLLRSNWWTLTSLILIKSEPPKMTKSRRKKTKNPKRIVTLSSKWSLRNQNHQVLKSQRETSAWLLFAKVINISRSMTTMQSWFNTSWTNQTQVGLNSLRTPLCLDPRSMKTIWFWRTSPWLKLSVTLLPSDGKCFSL